MGIVSQIVKKGLLHPHYPAECPKFELSKEQQLELNKEKYLVIKDTHYGEEFYVFKKDFGKPLTVDNINMRPVLSSRMESNPVRQKELADFYEKHPEYKR